MGGRALPAAWARLAAARDAEAGPELHHGLTADGYGLRLQRHRRAPCADVVLLVPGQGAGADLFCLPGHAHLVGFLHAHGFTDVWTLDSRLGREHPGARARGGFDLEDLAAFEHPAAVRLVRSHTGGARLHVIALGLGSVGLCMSLFGGALEGVHSVIAAGAALRVRTPARTLQLQHTLARLSERLGPAGSSAAAVLARACREQNLHPDTRRLLPSLYASAGPQVQRHLLEMAQAGCALKRSPARADTAHLRGDFLGAARSVRTPLLLAAGAEDGLFLDSNVACFHALEDAAPGRHALHVFPGYGHLDLFVGQHAARDVFPHFVRFLEAQRPAAAALEAPRLARVG